MKLIDTAVSAEYVGNWSAVEAIREVLQNYLDAKQEFNCSGRVDYRNGKVTIHDRGPGIDIKHFALGVSEKGDDLKGKYGEGLTIGCIALARLDRDIVIRSKNKEYRPIIKLSKTWKVETLHFQVRDTETPAGTQVIIPCSREELEAAKAYFIEFVRQQVRTLGKQFEWIEPGRISTPGGKIYINGTVEGHIENALFSYHLETKDLGDKDRKIIGNRDRSVLDMDVITPIIKTVLAHSGKKVASILVGMLAKDEHRKEDCPWELTHGIAYWNIASPRVWKQAFTEHFGEKICLTRGVSEDAQAAHNGYEVLTLPYAWAYVAETVGIPPSTELQKDLIKRIPLTRLKNEQVANLERAKMLVSHFYHDPGAIRIIQCPDTRGRYLSEEDLIELEISVLDDLKTLVNVLLHETCHKVTGFGDCTSDFQRAAFDIAASIILGDFNNH